MAVSKHQLDRSLCWWTWPSARHPVPRVTRLSLPKSTLPWGSDWNKSQPFKEVNQLCVKVTVKACPNSHSGNHDSPRIHWAGWPQIVGACRWRVPPGPPQETQERDEAQSPNEADARPPTVLKTRDSHSVGASGALSLSNHVHSDWKESEFPVSLGLLWFFVLQTSL